MMSGEPPAATVTIKRTGRDGYVCALATHDMIGSAAAPAARCKNVRRGNFIVSRVLAAKNRTSPHPRWQIRLHHCPVAVALGVAAEPPPRCGHDKTAAAKVND